MGRCPLSIFCSRGTPPQESITSEYGTYKTITARFWPWLELFLVPKSLNSFRLSLEQLVLRTEAFFTSRLSVGSNCLFQILDLYWCSPESGDLWCTSRQLIRTI